MKKILVTDVARINTFPIYGMVTSLISNNEEYMQWIYNNFIQLRYLVNDHVLMFEQYRSILFSCPYISTEVIDCKTVEEEYSSYVEFAKKCILQEGYLFIYCDRYYISEFWNNRQHDIHELFVVGFCDEQNTFYCWDNASDGKYKQFEVSYNEFEEAMKNRGVDKKYLYWNRCIGKKFKEIHTGEDT